MAQEEWAKVLEAIYKDQKYWQIDQGELEKFSDEMDLNEDLESILDALQSQDLIERDIDSIQLTNRGFEFINEKKNHEEQMLTQRLLLVFVTALSLGTLVNTVIKAGAKGNIFMSVIPSVLFAVIFIVLGMIAQKKLE